MTLHQTTKYMIPHQSGLRFSRFLVVLCIIYANSSAHATEPPPSVEALKARLTSLVKDKDENLLHGLAWDLMRRAATVDEPSKVSLWLSTYQTLKKACDPAFNPDDVSAINITPPGGDIPGIAPEGIKDPELRRQYELALAANREKSNRHRYQSLLRKQLEELRRDLPIILGTSGADGPDRARNAVSRLKKYDVPNDVLVDLLAPQRQ